MNIYYRFILSLSIVVSLMFVFSHTSYAVESPECVLTATIDSAGVWTEDSLSPITASSLPACTSIDTGSLGFQIPTLGDILTFAVRAFFAIAGLAALFYMLLGAFAWVTSGGDKDAITAAREKIQAAVVGMILIVAVLAVIWTLEQVIFKRRICLGLSCSVTLPGLIESQGKTILWGNGIVSSSTEDAFCCVCAKGDGGLGDRINSRFLNCADGVGEPL